MTSIPRPRQTQDHELLVMSRICDLLALLPLDARRRVVDYVNLRVSNLPTIAAVGNGEAPGEATGDGLFETEPGDEPATADAPAPPEPAPGRSSRRASTAATGG